MDENFKLQNVQNLMLNCTKRYCQVKLYLKKNVETLGFG